MDHYIDSAVNHYRALLEAQLERTGRMENAAPPKDFAALEKVTIGVIDGDGIGPIITGHATRVLEALLSFGVLPDAEKAARRREKRYAVQG